MLLPRFRCPVCGRSTAVTVRGLLYRHDPAGGRTSDLRSCRGSLKPVVVPAVQPVLFAVEPPEVGEGGAAGAPPLF